MINLAPKLQIARTFKIMFVNLSFLILLLFLCIMSILRMLLKNNGFFFLVFLFAFWGVCVCVCVKIIHWPSTIIHLGAPWP